MNVPKLTGVGWIDISWYALRDLLGIPGDFQLEDVTMHIDGQIDGELYCRIRLRVTSPRIDSVHGGPIELTMREVMCPVLAKMSIHGKEIYRGLSTPDES